MACNRCKRTSSDPFNFLLSCCECGKNWHHRCHIPPLGDPELLALIRATNNNDVDNGLSSWIGKCCKRRRAQSQAIPEARTRSTPAPAVEAVEVLQPQSRSVSSSVKDPAITSHKAFQEKTSLSSGIATPPKLGDGLTFGDLGPQKPTAHVGSRMTTLVQPAAQHSDARLGTAPMSSGMAAKDGQLLHPTPLPTPSTRIVPPSLSNGPSTFVPYSRVPHFCESSLVLCRFLTTCGTY
ncbi:hypothetical protein BC826DRAFT_101839 [Russula brevipes]|nr:hypothetical protein BC826DRAFT_101839 [Russula brevipes]